MSHQDIVQAEQARTVGYAGAVTSTPSPGFTNDASGYPTETLYMADIRTWPCENSTTAPMFQVRYLVEIYPHSGKEGHWVTITDAPLHPGVGDTMMLTPLEAAELGRRLVEAGTLLN